jgi:DNA-binding NarL/FixJ family response regulator
MKSPAEILQPPTSPIHLALADDEISIAEAYAVKYASLGFVVDAIAFNGKLLLDALKNCPHTQVVLMDIGMPIMDGLQATQWLTANRPEIAVIALTGWADEENLCDMIRAGARGYVLKPESFATIAQAIHEVLEHHIYSSQLFVKGLKLNNTVFKQNGIEFTSREEEYMLHCCHGLTDKEIAKKMGISPHTAWGHCAHIFEKLGIDKRSSILLYAIKTGRYTVPMGRIKTKYTYA